MCGIIAYTGFRNSIPIITEGLCKLSYRGYDSAGLAVHYPTTGLHRWRVEGHPQGLQDQLKDRALPSGTGIGHNRWATHGPATVRNAHPHFSKDANVAVVHNGTIGNFDELRQMLESEQYHFASDTDTEVLAHLIERELNNGAIELHTAVRGALLLVDGAYAIAVISSRFPGEVVAASLHSPIVLGIGVKQLLVASDEVALVGHASSILRLGNSELVTLRKDGTYRHQTDAPRLPEPIEVSSTETGKGAYPHVMLKEIMEQPGALARTLRGRLKPKTGEIKLGGISPSIARRIAESRSLTIVGCGSSLYAGQIGRLYMERIAHLPCNSESASEFRYRAPVLGHQDVVLGISQSGETADTIQAILLARENGALCLGLTNRVRTTLPTTTDAGVFLQAGPEHAVASTKAFTAQVTALLMISLVVAEARNKKNGHQQLAQVLGNISALLEESLALEPQVKAVADEYRDMRRAFFIGRRYGAPLALEGALKLKEIAYVDAFGYPAGELKHGPLALIEEGVPVIAIVGADNLEDKMLSNMEEARARGAHLIALGPKGNTRIKRIARHTIELPTVPEELIPIVYAPILQLFAYHVGAGKGINVDEPRNLAKSVTVE